jgi:hypothetical protein
MTQITVTDELARAIAQAGSFVTLVDSNGRTIGQVTPLNSSLEGPLGMTDEHLTELERRMAEDDGTRYAFAEVIERVRGLAAE